MTENNLIEKIRRLEKKSYFFWLIFALSLLVIGESVWLVGILDKGANNSLYRKLASQTTLPLVKQKQQPPVAEISLETAKPIVAQTMGQAQLILKVKKDIKFQGLDLFIEYDPREARIVDDDASQSGIQVDAISKPIGQLARNLVDSKQGTIILSWVQLNPQGTELMAGDRVKLGTISFYPLGSAVSFKVRLAQKSGAGTKMTAALPDNQVLPLAEKSLQIGVSGQRK